MPTPLRYHCRRETLATITAVLVAHGYTVDPPLPTPAWVAPCTVMTCGLSTVILISRPNSDLAEIEVWGIAQAMAAQVLETLPTMRFRG